MWIDKEGYVTKDGKSESNTKLMRDTTIYDKDCCVYIFKIGRDGLTAALQVGAVKTISNETD
ncbi:MAG TPA: hypothetical protein VEL11_02160 [Candidatus Bathyarchaeia archaeon]|nr:hypothetical protein [Candidatus Bathyarchaeia archaeon]